MVEFSAPRVQFSVWSLHGAETSLEEFSHLCDQVPKKEQLEGGTCNFGSWFKEMGSIVVRSHHGREQLAACSWGTRSMRLLAHVSVDQGTVKKECQHWPYSYFPFNSVWLWDGRYPPSPSKLMARLTLIPLLIPLWNCLHRLSQKYVTLMSEAFLNLINLAIKINHHTHMLTQLFFIQGT